MLGGGQSQIPAGGPAAQCDLGVVDGESGIGEDGGEEGDDVGSRTGIGVGGGFGVVQADDDAVVLGGEEPVPGVGVGYGAKYEAAAVDGEENREGRC